MDVYWSTGAIFTIARAVGLAPFRLVHQDGHRRFLVSKSSVVFSALVCLAIVSCRVHTYRGFPTHNITQAVLMIQFLYDMFLAALNVSLAVFKSQALADFLYQIDRLDKRMAVLRFDVNKTHELVRRSAFIRIVISAIGISGALFQIIYILHIQVYVTSNAYLNWGLYFSVELINYISSCIFIQCVSLIGTRFHLINKSIIEMLTLSANPIATNATLDQVITLYTSLCDLACRVNGVYSIQLLLFVASMFANITTGFNNCFEDLLRISMKENNATLSPYIVFGICVGLMLTVHLTSFVVVCNYASAQTNHLSRLIHKMYVDKTKVHDRVKLRRFSLQLLHYQVRFTAGGWFPINNTLLYTIVGAVTTYLVILIQFELPQG